MNTEIGMLPRWLSLCSIVFLGWLVGAVVHETRFAWGVDMISVVLTSKPVIPLWVAGLVYGQERFLDC